MNAETIELVVVGAGRMGRMHLRALADLASVRVRDVVDPSPSAQDWLTGNGFCAHPDLAHALARRRPDGVLIAAPTDQHARHVAEAVTAGIPVLCEKPAGTGVGELVRTGELADGAGVGLQIAYWRRYVPALVDLRRAIRDGELGDLLHVECAQWDLEPPPASFRRTSGGIFVDMGVHEFDQIRWLTGRQIEGVQAAGTPCSDIAARPDVDSAQALLRLSGGVTATVSLGRHHPPGDLVTAEVFGTGGHRRVAVLDPVEGDLPMLEALRLQADSFARLIRTGVREGASVADATAAMDAAERAARALTGPVSDR